MWFDFGPVPGAVATTNRIGEDPHRNRLMEDATYAEARGAVM